MLVKVLLLFTLINCVYPGGEKAQPTFTYQSGDSHVFVFDKILQPLVVTYMKSLFIRNTSYSYYYPDPYEKDNRTANDGNLHWSAPVSPKLLIKMKFWAGVRLCYLSLPDEIIQGRRYLPYVAHGTMLRRGDYTIPFKGDVQRNDSIFVRVFMTPAMTKNIYSDQTFYDENDEIIASIHPKFARLVVWTGNISTLIRPPSMEYEQAEYSMFLKLTPHKELFQKSYEEFDEHLQKVQLHKSLPFPFTNHVNKFGIDKMNFSQHLIGKYYDKEGNVVAFFDDILPKEVLDQLRTYLTHYERGFGYNPYDPGSTESHDNVNWIKQFKVEKVLNTPYWEVVVGLSQYLSNNSQWYPYDVSCNLIQHTHHTRIHIDCVHEEFEYTFLLYLNPIWNENMYAETSFYNYAKPIDNTETKDKGGEANEMYDFLAAAVPKFGRIAIFRNLIPHSARPPSPNFLAARYTFPVKVAESYMQARVKMLSEALDYNPSVEADHPLYGPLRNGEYGLFLNDDKMVWVEEQYKKMLDYRDSATAADINEIESKLIPKKLRSG